MRASTVFALALALLIALAAAAGAKYAGLFDRKPAPPPEKPIPIKALFSRVGLWEDTTVLVDQVMVRDLSPEEINYLNSTYGNNNWKDKLMPALTTAAHMRTPKRNIQADTLLLREYFQDQSLPPQVTERLDPGMKAVNVTVTKDQSGGGVLRIGEYVDVRLNTKIGANGRDEIKTAVIARGCKVIMKRNNAWTVIQADPDDQPLHYTLQANPYRAALIEFAQSHGTLTLVPTGAPPKQAPGSFSDPTSSEYAVEDQRVEAINRGTLSIGDADLMRIFNVHPIPPVPSTPPVYIEHLVGVSPAGRSSFPPVPLGNLGTPGSPNGTSSDSPVKPAGGPQGVAFPPANGVAGASGGASFSLPSATGADPKIGGTPCKSCEEKRKAEEAAARAAAQAAGGASFGKPQ